MCLDMSGLLTNVGQRLFCSDVYDQCPDTGVSAGAVRHARTRALETLLSPSGWVSDTFNDSLHPMPPLNTVLHGALNDWACGGMEAMSVWLDRDDVQEALHVAGHGNNSQTYRSLPSTNDLRPLYLLRSIPVYHTSVDLISHSRYCARVLVCENSLVSSSLSYQRSHNTHLF